MRTIVAKLSVVAMATCSTGSITALASAQTGVPMPSPMDVINLRKSDGASPCGNNTRENPIENEIEAAYDRAGRCDSYSVSDWNDYSMWVLGLDRDDRPYGYEVAVDGRYVVGDYETVANYFNYHGITWWDGRYSPGYRETARFATQVAPGLAARYTGGPQSRQTTQATVSSAPTLQSSEDVGVCGIPVSTGLTAEAQVEASRLGTCDQIKQAFGY